MCCGSPDLTNTCSTGERDTSYYYSWCWLYTAVLLCQASTQSCQAPLAGTGREISVMNHEGRLSYQSSTYFYILLYLWCTTTTWMIDSTPKKSVDDIFLLSIFCHDSTSHVPSSNRKAEPQQYVHTCTRYEKPIVKHRRGKLFKSWAQDRKKLGGPFREVDKSRCKQTFVGNN